MLFLIMSVCVCVCVYVYVCVYVCVCLCVCLCVSVCISIYELCELVVVELEKEILIIYKAVVYNDYDMDIGAMLYYSNS